jgi:hypothetical protein
MSFFISEAIRKNGKFCKKGGKCRMNVLQWEKIEKFCAWAEGIFFLFSEYFMG